MESIYLGGQTKSAFPEFVAVSDNQFSVVLTVGVSQDVTVPAGANFVIINADGDFYAAYDNDVVIPGDSASMTSTVTEFNPSQRYVNGVSTIQFESDQLVHVHVAFYG